MVQLDPKSKRWISRNSSHVAVSWQTNRRPDHVRWWACRCAPNSASGWILKRFLRATALSTSVFDTLKTFFALGNKPVAIPMEAQPWLSRLCQLNPVQKGNWQCYFRVSQRRSSRPALDVSRIKATAGSQWNRPLRFWNHFFEILPNLQRKNRSI